MKDSVKVGIIMGSDSDLLVMKEAADVLDLFGISYEFRIVSAHRTPEVMVEFAKTAIERGLHVIIAGAGGAAHLPGMVASLTTIPVIGVPVRSRNSIDGWDSILSILQMPNGVPVATVALNAAKNAGLLACRILSVGNPQLQSDLENYRLEMIDQVKEKDEHIAMRFVRKKPLL